VVHNHLGVFNLERGRYPAAIRAFEAGIKLTPDNIRLLNNLGATYQQMGRQEEALKVYARSLSERPNADAYSNRGTCLFFMGRYDESADDFERATALNPDSWLYWINLADAYRWSSTRTSKARETYARAIELCEKDLALRPRDAHSLVMLAASYAKLGDPTRAANLASLAVDLAPKDAFTIYVAGVAFEIAGDREKAIRCPPKALDFGDGGHEMAGDPELREISKDPRLAKKLSARGG